MPTTLTIFGGINEIGGNKILIESKEARIFLDFGQSFSLLDGYFCDFLRPRERFGLIYEIRKFGEVAGIIQA